MTNHLSESDEAWDIGDLLAYHIEDSQYQPGFDDAVKAIEAHIVQERDRYYKLGVLHQNQHDQSHEASSSDTKVRRAESTDAKAIKREETDNE